MAVDVKKLDLRIGDVVEIDGRRYDVVSDRHGVVALEGPKSRPLLAPRSYIIGGCIEVRRASSPRR